MTSCLLVGVLRGIVKPFVVCFPSHCFSKHDLLFMACYFVGRLKRSGGIERASEALPWSCCAARLRRQAVFCELAFRHTLATLIALQAYSGQANALQLQSGLCSETHGNKDLQAAPYLAHSVSCFILELAYCCVEHF